MKIRLLNLKRDEEKIIPSEHKKGKEERYQYRSNTMEITAENFQKFISLLTYVFKKIRNHEKNKY